MGSSVSPWRAALAALARSAKKGSKSKGGKREDDEEDGAGAGTPGLAPPSTIKKKTGKPPGLLAASAAKKSGKRPPQIIEEPEAAESLMGESSWSDQERSQFLAALAAHGKNFKAVTAAVPSKSQAAVKGFFGKHKKTLGLDKIIADHAAREGDNKSGNGAAGGAGRGLHSSTFQLNLSALCTIGGARRRCVARVNWMLGGVEGVVCRVFSCVRHGSS